MRSKLPEWFLRAAFILVFAWFGVDKFVHPEIWTGFLPVWMDGLFGWSKDVWILIVGGSELFMAFLLLAPFSKIKQLGALLIILHLVAVLIQVGINDIGVRDAGLLLSAVALLLLLRQNERQS